MKMNGGSFNGTYARLGEEVSPSRPLSSSTPTNASAGGGAAVTNSTEPRALEEVHSAILRCRDTFGAGPLSHGTAAGGSERNISAGGSGGGGHGGDDSMDGRLERLETSAGEEKEMIEELQADVQKILVQQQKVLAALHPEALRTNPRRAKSQALVNVRAVNAISEPARRRSLDGASSPGGGRGGGDGSAANDYAPNYATTRPRASRWNGATTSGSMPPTATAALPSSAPALAAVFPSLPTTGTYTGSGMECAPGQARTSVRRVEARTRRAGNELPPSSALPSGVPPWNSVRSHSPAPAGAAGGPPASSRPCQARARVITRPPRDDLELQPGWPTGGYGGGPPPSQAAQEHARRATDAAISATLVRQYRAFQDEH